MVAVTFDRGICHVLAPGIYGIQFSFCPTLVGVPRTGVEPDFPPGGEILPLHLVFSMAFTKD